MSKTTFAIIGIIVVIVALGIIFGHKGSQVPPAPTSVVTSATSTIASTTPLSATSSATKMYTQATLTTNYGDIVIAFDPKIAPKTVENFITLASKGFYNTTKFHRVIKGFMIQGGDPLSKDDAQAALWGTGGPGYKFNDEITPESRNMIGAVAMANSGPNTNGSQFFINVANNSFLDGKYSVFAHVTSGLDIVQKISVVSTDPSNDRPLSPVVLESVVLK